MSSRFRHDVIATLGHAPDGPLALAVSGGPDSMAMLALATAAFPGQVIAATVDHGLRPDSAAEAAMVAAWCVQASIDHRTLVVRTPKGASENLHAWAREKRYFLLKRWAVECGAEVLCTAHHADDQAETFLMRAARGSGLSGLAAIRPRSDGSVPVSANRHPSGDGSTAVRYGQLTLLRPLLEWRRSELRDFATAAGIPFVDDPSNRDEQYDRSRFRRWLADAPWLDSVKISRSARYLAEADEDLMAVSHYFSSERALSADPSEARFDVTGLPRGVRRHLARGGIAFVCRQDGLAGPPPDNIEALLDALEAGKSATQAGVLASAKGAVWHFRPAPPRRSH